MAETEAVESVAAVVTVLAEGGAFSIDVDSELSPEILGAILRQAADQIQGRDDRAAGAWGR